MKRNHSNRTRIASLLCVAASLLGPVAHSAEKELFSSVRSACQPDEAWTFGIDLPNESTEAFRRFLAGELAPSRSFAQALALRRIAQTVETKAFSEYWISRSLLQARLFHIAHSGFSHLASRPIHPEAARVQLAALECLLRIQEQYASLTLPESIASQLPDFVQFAKSLPGAQGSRATTVAWQASHARVLALVAEDKPSSTEVEKNLASLKGAGAYENLARAWWSAKRRDHATTIQSIQRFFEQPVMPQPLKRFQDTAHLLMARAYYAQDQQEPAITHFKQINKRSNELANSLQELSWAFLMSEKYREAVGTAMNLHAGGLKTTFTPEAPMVMAMALNEICQFPDSLRAANMFRKGYEDTYRWLSQWKTDSRQDLYPLAVDYLKKRGKTPLRIASEWVRSPIFLSSQEELNLLLDEQEASKKVGRSGAQEQKKIARELVRRLIAVKPKVREARAKLKPSDPLPPTLVAELRKVRDLLGQYKKMQSAAPVWRTILAQHQNRTPKIKSGLLAGINSDLKRRTLRMHAQLEDIAENLQMIEIEIFNGASQDIIWQNAHPDYKEVAAEISKEADRSPAASSVWDWGRTTVSATEENEIWEDELGSFTANLVDNCSSKERYLALKIKGRN